MIDFIAMIFFLLLVGIFIVKILNVMTYKFTKEGQSLKYYGKEISIILLAVSLIAWLIMFTAFAGKAVEVQFYLDYGIPDTSYLEYGVLMSMSNIFIASNMIFTFLELILLFWVEIKTKGERYRRGQFENKHR